MNLNYKLAKEIYGVNPWFVDFASLPILLNVLEMAKNNSSVEKDSKCNTPQIFDVKNAKLINDYESWKLNRVGADESVISIINLDGPITKNGGSSSVGMNQLSSIMLSQIDDKRVKGFIVLADSGGGSSQAVEVMVNAINQAKKVKPVYAMIPTGGTAASAAYGIISACNGIYAESDMSMVGSAGTMIEIQGRVANSVSPDGVKNIRLYATKSTLKNKAFEEAINSDNYDLIINELLDPINENFLNMIAQNRPILNGTDFDTGKHIFTKDAVGTFIDGIMPFNDLVNKVLSESKTSVKQKLNNNNQISNQMDVNEIKQNHPEAYQEIFALGVSAEADRAGAWLAHAKTDLDGVISGIKSGKDITQTESQEFLVKSVAQKKLEEIEVDNPEVIDTPESKNEVEDNEEKELAASYEKIAKML